MWTHWAIAVKAVEMRVELAESVALLQSKIVQRAHIMGLLLINFIIGILVLVTIAVDMLIGEEEYVLVT